MKPFLLQLSLLCAVLCPSVMAQRVVSQYDFSIAVRGLTQEDPDIPILVIPTALPLEYPPRIAALARLGGEVHLRFRISEEGTVTNVTIKKKSLPELDDAAVAAVMKWRFGVHLPRGDKISREVWMQCRIVFTIEEE